MKMDHYEMAEALRKKADVTYEEARDTLEKCNWDMLDALVLLEESRKVREGAGYAAREKKNPCESRREKAREGLDRLWDRVKKMLVMGNSHQFVVSRKGSELVSMPVTVMALLLILFRRFSLAALLIGLFLGARYAFRGPDLQAQAGDSASGTQVQAASDAQAPCGAN